MARKCKSFTVEQIDEEFKETILQGLVKAGAEILEENPLTIDLKKKGVVVTAIWNEVDNTITIKAIKKNRRVPCWGIRLRLKEEIEKARNDIEAPELFNLEFFEE